MKTTLQPATRAAFERLIDYAGLFPPAKLAMAPALEEYARCRSSAHAWMLGPFIVPASRLDELLALVAEPATPIPLSVIVDAGTDTRSWLDRVDGILARLTAHAKDETGAEIVALEIPLPKLLSRRDTYEAMIGQCASLVHKHGLRERPVYVEFPRDERYEELLINTIEAIRRYGMRGKIRCGGVTPEAFPTTAELAAYIRTDRECGGGFKATAGLHHPVRHHNEAAGVAMHGFLNILVAAALSGDHDADDLVPILDDEDPSHFTVESDSFRYRGKSIDVQVARTHFMSYGSCSFAEPVEDLIALHLLPKD